MTRDELTDEVRRFIGDELLGGEHNGLDESTPLLEWGVLDSLSVAQLLSFAEERYAVDVPEREVNPHNLKDIAAFVDLLERLR
jgi:acyl carrier protein